MMERAAAVDHTGFVETLEDMTIQFDNDLWCIPGKDFLLALTAEGQVAAMGRLYINPAPLQERKANLGEVVHPEHRSRGLEEVILTWMEAHACQRLREYPADLPRFLRANSQDYQSERISLFERHGFSPLRYWYSMRRDLSQPIPDEHLPSGLTLCTYHPELDRHYWRPSTNLSATTGVMSRFPQRTGKPFSFIPPASAPS
jgi:GNAT superfamily N-acetyltransferase